MSEHVLRTDIAHHAEESARWWVQNPDKPKPECNYPAGTEAAAAWQAMFSRYLLVYSAVTADQETSA